MGEVSFTHPEWLGHHMAIDGRRMWPNEFPELRELIQASVDGNVALWYSGADVFSQRKGHWNLLCETKEDLLAVSMVVGRKISGPMPAWTEVLNRHMGNGSST